MNAFTALRLITPRQWSRRANAVDRIYLPDSNIEATGWFLHDASAGIVFHASLIGLLIDEEPLTTDEAVDRYGLAQVTAWEWASVALANEGGQ